MTRRPRQHSTHTTAHTTLHKNNVRRSLLYTALADSKLHHVTLKGHDMVGY